MHFMGWDGTAWHGIRLQSSKLHLAGSFFTLEAPFSVTENVLLVWSSGQTGEKEMRFNRSSGDGVLFVHSCYSY